MKRLSGGLCAAGIAAILVAGSLRAAPASCDSLATLALRNVRITRAQLVPAGRFAGTPAGILAPGDRSFAPYNALPEFCRVAATLTPSGDSDITIEVWMPAATWNGRFQAAGNGGWAGQISLQALARGIPPSRNGTAARPAAARASRRLSATRPTTTASSPARRRTT